MKQRSIIQKIIDFTTFPLRAISIFEENRWGLTSLRNERFDFCASHVMGYCLDVGCGRHNIFITQYLNGQGKGIDVFPYDGLKEENLVKDISHFPFKDESFDTVTFIANINHIPASMRDIELKEAYRCLQPGGNIIVTMGKPLAEISAHWVVGQYDKLFNTDFDVDHERGMSEEESYYLKSSEILLRLSNAGFVNIKRKSFWTQWFLNAMFVAYKISS